MSKIEELLNSIGINIKDNDSKIKSMETILDEISDKYSKLKKRVFLGGTCANSLWRDKLIPMLTIDYFNPVVSNWTPECQLEKLKQREECDFVLYVLTRIYSTFSIAEVVDDSNKRPEKTILCIMNEKLPNGKWALDSQELKHLDAIGRLVKRNGGLYFNSLEEVANYLNK